MRAWQQGCFTSFDQQSIAYRRWPGQGQQAIIILHRAQRLAETAQSVADELGLLKADIYAWDARGHGQSGGKPGEAVSLGISIHDLDCFITHLTRQYGHAPTEIVLIGQSIGAAVAAGWVHDYAPCIAALVLVAPAFRLRLFVPPARIGLGLALKMRQSMKLGTRLQTRYLTHDPARVAQDDQPWPQPVAGMMLRSLFDTARRIIADAATIRVPTLLLQAGCDLVAAPGPQNSFFRRLGSKIKEKHFLEGQYHDLFDEPERDATFALIRSFLEQAQDRLLPVEQWNQYLEEDTRKFSWAFPGFRKRSPAAYSDGLAMPAQATTLMGGKTFRRRNPVRKVLKGRKLAASLRALRERRQHVRELIQLAARQLAEQDQALHIADIAAGTGKETLAALNGLQTASLCLRDHNPACVATGRNLLAAYHLQQLARFETGNAFDLASLQLLGNPTLVIVCGLYELFAANAPVRDSLAGLAAIMPQGSYLVYSNQPWQLQHDLLGKLLAKHDAATGSRRLRSQAEMDELVQQAGFTKLEQRIDEQGIYSVSLAVRR